MEVCETYKDFKVTYIDLISNRNDSKLINDSIESNKIHFLSHIKTC